MAENKEMDDLGRDGVGDAILRERQDHRERILEVLLGELPFDGWSEELLKKSALEAAGDASLAWRLFPDGSEDVIHLWSRLLDAETLKRMAANPQEKIRMKVLMGVRHRLELLEPHKEAARKTAIFLARHPVLMQSLIHETVSQIWYGAGDTSTDYNYYTKRGLLAAVYTSTFLYWLEDTSPDHEKTWVFLARRIDQVLKIPQIPGKLRGLWGDLTYRLGEIYGALRP